MAAQGMHSISSAPETHSIWQQLGSLRHQFFVDRQPEQALTGLNVLLENPQLSRAAKMAAKQLAGFCLLSLGRYPEACGVFESIDDAYLAGYSHILAGNLDNAIPYWQQVANKRENHWCVSLFGILTRQLQTCPTLFQIRNHLEMDVSHLLAANQQAFVENVCHYADLLAQLNMEAYKFIGRALLNANRLPEAGPFLIQAQKTLPNDPEIYFHLGEYYAYQQAWPEVRVMINQCLLISPTYTPAKELLARLPE